MKRILIGTIAVMMSMPVMAEDTPATGDKTITSKPYVDTQIATKQLKIPAANTAGVGPGDSVITYTNVAGGGVIGERALFTGGEYNASTDADKMITASALNNAFTNLPTTDTTTLECANADCTLWTIVDQTAYGETITLPAGYTRLEYVQSSGGQYINTGVFPTNDTVVDVKFVNTAAQGDSTTRVVIGDRYSGGAYLLSITANTNAINRIGGLYKALTSYWTLDTPFVVHMDSSGINVNGSIINWNGNVTNFIGTEPLTMFGTTDIASRYAKVKMYYLKITDNGVLTRHFIPVSRVNNNTTEIGMYDIVNNRFYLNQGNGGFTAGPAVR